MNTASPHLDMDALEALKEIMGDEFPLLIETFTSDSSLRLKAIDEAVVAADGEAIRRAAHSFKGSASNMGAVVLTGLCRQLEDLGREGDVATAFSVQQAIIDEYAQVASVLAAL